MMKEKLLTIKQFLQRNRTKLAFGALILSTVVSMPSYGRALDAMVEKAAEIATLVFVSELLFIAGIALIAASQKNKILSKKNLSKQYIKDVVLSGFLDDNGLLRAGLAINTAGALGTGFALVYGALTVLPTPMILSALALAGMDIAATIAIRYNIYKGLSFQQGKALPD